MRDGLWGRNPVRLEQFYRLYAALIKVVQKINTIIQVNFQTVKLAKQIRGKSFLIICEHSFQGKEMDLKIDQVKFIVCGSNNYLVRQIAMVLK